LVLVSAQPGSPYEGERHDGHNSPHEYANSAYGYSTRVLLDSKKPFQRNVRHLLDLCWPDTPFDKQLRAVWLTQSVLCTPRKQVSRRVCETCGERYLRAQLALFPNALVVALGNDPRDRLRAIGVTDFLAVAAVGPPEGNKRRARESWRQIPMELRRRGMGALN
jgi:hypothetical protein